MICSSLLLCSNTDERFLVLFLSCSDWMYERIRDRERERGIWRKTAEETCWLFTRPNTMSEFTRCPLLFSDPWRARPLYVQSHQFNYNSAMLHCCSVIRVWCLCYTGRLFTLLMMCRSRSQPLSVNGVRWGHTTIALLTQVYICVYACVCVGTNLCLYLR